MTDKTRQILAMTLGAVGLVLAIVATIVALNAKQVADSDQTTTAEVRQEVASALESRARQQQKQLGRVERFVNQLSSEEKGGLGSLRALKRRVNRLSREVRAIESDQRAESNDTDQRFGATNRNVANLRQQVQRLETRLDLFQTKNRP